MPQAGYCNAAKTLFFIELRVQAIRIADFDSRLFKPSSLCFFASPDKRDVVFCKDHYVSPRSKNGKEL